MSEFTQWIDSSTQEEKDTPVSIELRDRATGRVVKRYGRSTRFDARRFANWNRPGGVCDADNLEVVEGQPDPIRRRSRKAVQS